MKTANILLAAVFVMLVSNAAIMLIKLFNDKTREFYQKGYKKAFEMSQKAAQNEAKKYLAQMMQSYSVKDIIVTTDDKTVVKWNDGKTTWVKLKEGDVFNPFKAFCYCLLKQMYGDAWKDMFKKHGIVDTQANEEYEISEQTEK